MFIFLLIKKHSPQNQLSYSSSISSSLVLAIQIIQGGGVIDDKWLWHQLGRTLMHCRKTIRWSWSTRVKVYGGSGVYLHLYGDKNVHELFQLLRPCIIKQNQLSLAQCIAVPEIPTLLPTSSDFFTRHLKSLHLQNCVFHCPDKHLNPRTSSCEE